MASNAEVQQTRNRIKFSISEIVLHTSLLFRAQKRHVVLLIERKARDSYENMPDIVKTMCRRVLDAIPDGSFADHATLELLAECYPVIEGLPSGRNIATATPAELNSVRDGILVEHSVAILEHWPQLWPNIVSCFGLLLMSLQLCRSSAIALQNPQYRQVYVDALDKLLHETATRTHILHICYRNLQLMVPQMLNAKAITTIASVNSLAARLGGDDVMRNVAGFLTTAMPDNPIDRRATANLELTLRRDNIIYDLQEHARRHGRPLAWLEAARRAVRTSDNPDKNAAIEAADQAVLAAGGGAMASSSKGDLHATQLKL